MNDLAIEGLKALIDIIADPQSSPEALFDLKNNTPSRVVAAFCEMTNGYFEDPEEFLLTRFPAESDDVVILRDIEFVSLCEHHLMPFTGRAHVGYIPIGEVVGLSKLARVVDLYARRLQIQERMCRQIAQAIERHVPNAGVAVVIEAQHDCLSCRGAAKQNSRFVTSAMFGAFRDKAAARAEFFSLIKGDRCQ